MHIRTSTEKTPRVILDTDMGADCDDAGAMALLHQFAATGEATLLAVIHSSAGRMPWGVHVCSAINTYYGRPDVPLGAYRGPDVGEPADKILAEAIARDPRIRGDQLHNAPDAPNALDLYRATLGSQPDKSVTIVTIGHLKVLHDLLRADPELVRQKVRELVVMGGQFPQSGADPEWNFGANDSAPYTKVLEHWPGRVVYTGFEIGIGLRTGRDFVHGPSHNPVARAYQGFHEWHKEALNLGRPSWDQTAVLYAVRGTGPEGSEYWQLSEVGKISIDARGGNHWNPHTKGRQHYLIESMAAEKLTKIIDDLMMAAPKE